MAEEKQIDERCPPVHLCQPNLPKNPKSDLKRKEMERTGMDDRRENAGNSQEFRGSEKAPEQEAAESFTGGLPPSFTREERLRNSSTK